MKTVSNVRPKSHWIEKNSPTMCDVIFTTNVAIREIEVADSDEKQTEYAYDMYRLHTPYSETLAERINKNYQAWLDVAIKDELDTLRSEKTKEVREKCQSTIYRGIDVETEYGSEHFSLDIHDQQNISAIRMLLANGIEKYPYHADGKECVAYSAEDLIKIVKTATTFITYHTTYCNMLKIWLNRETDVQAIKNIVYGCELPSDLKEYMDTLL